VSVIYIDGMWDCKEPQADSLFGVSGGQ